MKNKLIKDYLSILNINSINQLEENDLDYWHQKRFIEIQRSSSDKEFVSRQLIELNNAKEYLDQINLKDIKDVINSLKTNHDKNSNFQQQEDLKKEQKSYPNLVENDIQVTSSSSNIKLKYFKNLIWSFLVY